jgi:hypothetical protein
MKPIRLKFIYGKKVKICLFYGSQNGVRGAYLLELDVV